SVFALVFSCMCLCFYGLFVPIHMDRYPTRRSSDLAFHRESDTSALHFLKWKLPIKFDVTTLSEKEYRKVERTKDEAIDHGLEQARRELRLQLGPDAEIISEKILHDVTENGKVKLILHMNVEEDIVKKEPINQGD